MINDRSLQCWGGNYTGELATTSLGYSVLPVPVANIAGVKAVSISTSHVCAVLESGAVDCWGRIYGGTDSEVTYVPTPVLGLDDAIAVANGSNHACALLQDGTVRCWGANYAGQLGDGTTNDSTTPVQVLNVATGTAIASRDAHSCALLGDGTIWCWGEDVYGALGDGKTSNSAIPVQVSGIGSASAVAGLCAILWDGTASCWGSAYLLLGLSTANTNFLPVTVPGISNGLSIIMGDSNACVKQVGGNVLCWGDNLHGSLGCGSAAGSSARPCSVIGL